MEGHVRCGPLRHHIILCTLELSMSYCVLNKIEVQIRFNGVSVTLFQYYVSCAFFKCSYHNKELNGVCICSFSIPVPVPNRLTYSKKGLSWHTVIWAFSLS